MRNENTRPILVAGKTGQLARCLIDIGQKNCLPILAASCPEFDITDPEAVDRVISVVGPRAIVNAAAYTAVDRAESEPERAFAVNRDGAARLAVASRRLGIPFIHVSSDYVFDGGKPSAYGEEDPASPLGIYGRSKLEGEWAVLDADPSALILRTSWVYSPYGANFVKTMLRLAETRDVVRVVDDQYGTPTGASDLAHAILKILGTVESGQGRAGIYHVTGIGETTWSGFASAIFAGWSVRGRRVPMVEPILTVDYPTLAKRPANSRLDCAKIERIFGIRLQRWSESLETCLDALAVAQRKAQSC